MLARAHDIPPAARDALNLYFPLRYYHRRGTSSDRHSYAQLTRFIPESARGQFDCIAAPRVRQEEMDQDNLPPFAPVSIDNMLNDLLG